MLKTEKGKQECNVWVRKKKKPQGGLWGLFMRKAPLYADK